MMIIFRGKPAHTLFRLNKQLALLQAISPVESLTAEFCYFFDVDKNWQENQREPLARLLHASASAPDWTTEGGETWFWVVPRIGTLSPWSTKACEIIENSGFAGVKNVVRGIAYCVKTSASVQDFTQILHDPLLESVLLNSDEFGLVFQEHRPAPLNFVPVLEKGKNALLEANQRMGLALSEPEIQYLLKVFQRLKRNPTDVEVMMFAQVNSEHCRHKIFNGRWVIDEQPQEYSLFEMIRYTFQQNPGSVLVAYADNAAVLKGSKVHRWLIEPQTRQYKEVIESAHIVFKVETHNHPTAISPFPGAATGSGGEIRDEAATGRGAYPKAGWSGFAVSHLLIPGFSQPWEEDPGKPAYLASALDIMLQAPLGAASFNNEFGRPNIAGYFRTCLLTLHTEFGPSHRGFHKPIMIAGGLGTIRESQIQKHILPAESKLIVLGGPAMAIGLGGGSASSRSTGENAEKLDFASVQRSNPEMQRRCQEVINACWSLGENNPILSIHDVGAGGLANALPEIVAAAEKGAKIDLRAIPNADPGMSPLQIWCNEAQERFVLAVEKKDLALFEQIARRERCPYAVVGEVTAKPEIIVGDPHFKNNPVSLPNSVLFEEMPRLLCNSQRVSFTMPPFKTHELNLEEVARRVLQFPCVSNKSFLITIGDRSVTGLVARDQMVGPWQIPVADVAVTSADYRGVAGEALAIGERPPIALVHPAASARMAVGEAITNIAAARIEDISKIALSANWMAATDYLGEGAALYDAVQTVALELCPALGICIPVGKDSLSMRTLWQEEGQPKSVTSPLSLIITAAAPVLDVRATLTPQLRTDQEKTILILIDLGEGSHCMAGSVLEQVYGAISQRPPDVDDPDLLKQFFHAIQTLNRENLLLAYHDRSDGGLFVTICEMMFAGRVGVNLTLDSLIKNENTADPAVILFNEELGAVVQIRERDQQRAFDILQQHQLKDWSYLLGGINTTDRLDISYRGQPIFQQTRTQLQQWWSETSYRMQMLRDNPECAQEEYDNLLSEDPGLSAKLNFALPKGENQNSSPAMNRKSPKVAILREQGVNGHMEMAAAFARVGFSCEDVHMTDLLSGKVKLTEFTGMAAVGGFSYGDVLGAGRGWAQSILNHSQARSIFAEFFNRPDTFTFGACNGCQMLADLKELIPGAESWPVFTTNRSEQFEARLSMVEILSSPSLFFKGMAGSFLPIVVAHGQGRAEFSNPHDLVKLEKEQLVALRFVDNHYQVTERYPYNPNGSPKGITALSSRDGRVLVVMPHPERVFRTQQFSWHPDQWEEDSPWLQMFLNARAWVG